MKNEPKKTDKRKRLGDYGENLALREYERDGFQLIEQQYHCRFGEIDLILKKGNCIYFVEVRTKASVTYGSAEESITAKKKETIHKVSQHFLVQNGGVDVPVQFDVVTIYIDKHNKQAYIKRYPHAF